MVVPVTLQDAVGEELPFLRAEAEARMVSRCTVRRKTGAQTTGPTGYKVPEWADVTTGLPARFPPARGGAARSRTLTIGGTEVQVAVREMHVPIATTGLRDGDLVLVTAGEATGAVWQIVEAAPPPDQATALRLDVVAVQPPKEWS